jgi:hypothetical protein
MVDFIKNFFIKIVIQRKFQLQPVTILELLIYFQATKRSLTFLTYCLMFKGAHLPSGKLTPWPVRHCTLASLSSYRTWVLLFTDTLDTVLYKMSTTEVSVPNTVLFSVAFVLYALQSLASSVLGATYSSWLWRVTELLHTDQLNALPEPINRPWIWWFTFRPLPRISNSLRFIHITLFVSCPIRDDSKFLQWFKTVLWTVDIIFINFYWPFQNRWRRSQCPRGLRRGCTAARLLGLWVRIPPGAWMSVCCECCVLSGRGLCDELVPRAEESYRLWCVWVWSWSLEKWGVLGPQGAVEPLEKKEQVVM